jgi:hypothetical protein
MPFRAALTRDDVAGKNLLAAKNLQSEPLAVGVAAVAGRSACFLVSHDLNSEIPLTLNPDL